MSDPIQRSSTIPLPPHHLESGQHDPLPEASSRQQERTGDARAAAQEQVRRGGFEAYLDQQSVTTLRRIQDGLIFDPATEIEKASIYQGLGDPRAT